MNNCAICKHPIGAPVDATEQRDEDGFVQKFVEKFECENCGATGRLRVDQRGNKIPEEHHTGRLFNGYNSEATV